MPNKRLLEKILAIRAAIGRGEGSAQKAVNAAVDVYMDAAEQHGAGMSTLERCQDRVAELEAELKKERANDR